MRRTIQLAIASVAVLSASAAQLPAAIIPFGVQNDVDYSTVTNTWGWTLLYRGAYGQFDIPVSTMFGGAGDYLMLGAIHVGSSTLEVLAAAPTSDVLTYTSLNTTRLSNGARWYFNGYSMGFAGPTDTINQTSADTNGQNERDRLSWHTGIGRPGFAQDYTVAPSDIDGGWRAGAFTGLNNSTVWDRVVFTANLAPQQIDPAPEPSSLVLLGMGLVSLGGYAARRRKQAASAA